MGGEIIAVGAVALLAGAVVYECVCDVLRAWQRKAACVEVQPLTCNQALEAFGRDLDRIFALPERQEAAR